MRKRTIIGLAAVLAVAGLFTLLGTLALAQDGQELHYGETVSGDLVRDRLQFVVARVRIGVRVKQEIVDSVVLHTVDLGPSGQFEHPVQGDRRVVRPVFFSDEAGPHGVVQFGERV